MISSGENLKEVIRDTVRENPYSGLLFSGGLDTSILAAIKPDVTAVSVSFQDQGEDIYYSKIVVEHLGLQRFHKKVRIEEAVEVIPQVIKILGSFDPALPNDLVVYFGFRFAAELGLDSIATGDGSDELFAGYSFMQGMEDLESYLERIAEKMVFSSNDLAEHFGLRLIQPYLEKRVVDLALDTPVDLKIRQRGNKLHGKWILRTVFEDMLPEEVAWQSKRPLEFGSGMTRIREIIENKVSDEEFKDNKHGIKFFNKEHLYYYKVYKKVVGEIPQPVQGQKVCPGCGTGLNRDDFHCKLCGHVLPWKTPLQPTRL